MLTAEKKGRVQTSIAIVALCDGYSLNEFKIAIQRSDGLLDTVMKEVASLRVGTTYIPVQYLKEMFETSGQKVIEANMAIGESDEQS